MIGVDVTLNADAVEAALAERADQLRSALEDRIKQNLSGDVLNMRSGALLDSVSSDLEDDGSEITISAKSEGVPYAAILEYGGKTAAHDIVATKAKALAFMTGGGERFAKRVHHPGSLIPAFAYMGSALDALQDEITSGLKEAVIATLGGRVSLIFRSAPSPALSPDHPTEQSSANRSPDAGSRAHGCRPFVAPPAISARPPPRAARRDQASA